MVNHNNQESIDLDKYRKKDKKNISISIDVETIEKLKKQNINISKLVNNLLKNLTEKM